MVWELIVVQRLNTSDFKASKQWYWKHNRISSSFNKTLNLHGLTTFMKKGGFVRQNIRVVSLLFAKRRFRPPEGIVFSPESENTRQYLNCRVFFLIIRIHLQKTFVAK